ncbi:hypothetical protein DH2020_026128 [Rehmannia glutinosa]|uniref:Ankyrin repeat domain-containing protein n=1 Tax=Rehmannia glutinosa TaxID=99300 RepID=A0ABR0W1F8_REHGL
MAVPDGRRGGDDEDGAALFEEDGVDFADDEDIDHFEIPLHLRPLVSAAEAGDLNALRLALGYTEIAQLLINFANDSERVKRMLETVDMEGDTPLHHAARGEYGDIIRLLLAYGASTTRTNVYGKTPTELADPGTEARRILEEATGDVLSH